jgi:hypothetical protein
VVCNVLEQRDYKSGGNRTIFSGVLSSHTWAVELGVVLPKSSACFILKLLPYNLCRCFLPLGREVRNASRNVLYDIGVSMITMSFIFMSGPFSEGVGVTQPSYKQL